MNNYRTRYKGLKRLNVPKMGNFSAGYDPKELITLREIARPGWYFDRKTGQSWIVVVVRQKVRHFLANPAEFKAKLLEVSFIPLQQEEQKALSILRNYLRKGNNRNLKAELDMLSLAQRKTHARNQ